jgi:small subunit ribosomal protein S4
MVNYYKPKYKKWLRNGKLIFSEKVPKFGKFGKKKWQSFKIRNKNPSLQPVITFEERLRLESERGLYRKSLIQKQILRSFYGNLSEEQFKALILKSDLFNTKSKLSFVSLLESRLDVFLYRAHLVGTLNEARQAISHKKVKVNGTSVKSKSYLLSPGDLVQMNISNFDQKSSISNKTSGFKVKDTFSKVFSKHIQIDFKTRSAVFLEYPKMDEVLYPFDVSLKNVKEFYNI